MHINTFKIIVDQSKRPKLKNHEGVLEKDIF